MSWWINYKNEFILMLEYIESIKTRKDLDSFFKDYKTESIIRMVFESNTIENEGLDFTGTKKLFSDILKPSLTILENRKAIDKKGENLTKQILKNLKNLTDNLTVTSLNDSKLILYKDKKKEFITTLNHLTLISSLDYIFRETKEKYPNYIQIFNSKHLKAFHGNLSNNLDNNNNGMPGEYRSDAAYIDLDTIFLQPSLIPEAIEEGVKVLFKNLEDGKNMYLEIMLFVAKFIKIHPFGDCNGRLSRIILNLVFLFDDVPFYLILRSNSRDKKKYIESMREFYQKKKISKFISVVSKAFIKQIEEINDSLELANKELIKPLKLSNEFKEKLKIELDNF